MEPKFRLTYNGQQVQQQDFNLIGDTAGLADDRVFAELLRITPFDGTTTTKGILPTSTSALIAPNGATGSVLVNPFRAFVGSRTEAGTDAHANWNDIRSVLSVANGTTALTVHVSFAANSSGSARWDLVYAQVAIDTASTPITRKVKDNTSGIVTPTSVSQYVQTTMTVQVLAGSPNVNPAFPALPSDSGGNYYIALGYVRVPNGFSATSTVLTTDICEQAPILMIARATGASRVEPSNQQYVVSTSKQNTWGATGVRPRAYIPPTMTGKHELVTAFAFDFTPNYVNNATIDSRNWLKRMCSWKAVGGAEVDLAWLPDHRGAPYAHRDWSGQGVTGTTVALAGVTYQFGMGSTFNSDADDGSGPSTFSTCVYISGGDGAGGGNSPLLPTGVTLRVYADIVDGGKLKVNYSGVIPTDGTSLILFMDFYGSFDNV